MLLMIWVNDFWILQDIPKWLKHAASQPVHYQQDQWYANLDPGFTIIFIISFCFAPLDCGRKRENKLVQPDQDRRYGNFNLLSNSLFLLQFQDYPGD